MFRILERAVPAVASLVLAGPVAAQTIGRGEGPYYGHMWGWGGGFFGWALMLLFWVGIIYLVVTAVRGRGLAGGSGRSPALNLLQERLAKGEIDAEEYAARKKVLEQ